MIVELDALCMVYQGDRTSDANEQGSMNYKNEGLTLMEILLRFSSCKLRSPGLGHRNSGF